MAVTDFLFNGSPPPSINTYGTTTANTPQWLSDYSQGIAAKANAVAAEPYQPYDQPRIAGFTDPQKQAFSLTQNSIGGYQPALNQAVGYTQGAAANNPMSAANPYFNQANQSSASLVGQYMNPYDTAVVNRLGQLGARNLNENLLPTIGDNFTRAGQYGSSRMQEMTGRALRDVQESTLAAQNQALQQGYGQALTAAGNDLSRYGNLGQAAGNLVNAGNANLINAANAQANLAQTGQAMNFKDASALEAIGAEQQGLNQKNLDVQRSDFLDQRQYPQQMVQFLNNAIRGIPYSTQTNTVANAPTSTYQPSGLSQLVGGLGLINKLG